MPTYYVSAQTGNDQNDGLSPQTAWATLTKAANAVVAGDTVRIAPGVYREMLDIPASGRPDAPIEFVGDPWATEFPELLPGDVVITGFDADTDPAPARDYGVRIYRQNYITLRHLLTDGAKNAGVYIEGHIGNYKDHLLSDLTIRRCPTGIHRMVYDDTATTQPVVYDVPWRIVRCRIHQVSTGILEQHKRTDPGRTTRPAQGIQGLRMEGCRIEAENVGIHFYANGVNYYDGYGWHIAPARVDADVVGGSVRAPTAFRYSQTGSWAEGATTITGVEVEADTLASWDNHPVTFQDVDIRYVTTLVTGLNGGTKTIAGARIEHLQSLGSGFSVGQPIWGPIPDHQRRSGLGIDAVNPISGRKSARLAVPLTGEHAWLVPGSKDVPLVVSLKARKNFVGGPVKFYLGPSVAEMHDNTAVQTLTLSYVPRKTMLIPLRVVAEAPSYSPNHAVWIDDVIVS